MPAASGRGHRKKEARAQGAGRARDNQDRAQDNQDRAQGAQDNAQGAQDNAQGAGQAARRAADLFTCTLPTIC